MPDAPAVQAERLRDLAGQVAEIGQADVPEILFQHISPGREPVTVYSTKDGCPTPIPAYMVRSGVMNLTNEDGTFRFVAEAKDAPTYKLGTIKCFLHKDSPERTILELVGLGAATCPKATLASLHAKRLHGLARHKQEFAAWQEFVEREKEAKREKRLDEQLEATLSIARGGAAPQTSEESGDSGIRYNVAVETVATGDEIPAHITNFDPKTTCNICGKTGLKRVNAHKSMVHKEA